MYGLLLIVFLIAIFGICVIIRDMNRFVVAPYEIRSRKIKKKYTFVMLSDLHNKSFGIRNDRLIKAVVDCHPDSIITAGDMYTSKKGTGFDNALALLEALSNRFPVYIANGNHESKTQIKPDDFDNMYGQFVDRLASLGLRPLVNERLALPEINIDLCGLQIGQEYFGHFTKKEMTETYMDKLVGKANRDCFQILIAHNPVYFKKYADWGADLVLSGHIHGGIVRLPWLGGVISPTATFFPKYDGGRFQEGTSTMILGRGLSTHTLPIRMWNPGEIVLVTLLPEEA
ncbi:MAG: hypothetical protein HFI94_07370 [Lachnospiraceae bacterium]|nr:hypothetical protein [Lachnospiraceae bacterium]